MNSVKAIEPRPLSQKAKREQAKQEARDRLRKLAVPGSTIYTKLDHVSRSGMLRVITLYIIEKNIPIDISRDASLAMGYRRDEKHGGLRAGGCGMDMGFHLVHNLSYCLHGNQSKGTDAIEADRRGVPFTPTRRQYRAGYSLIHRWM